MGEVKAGEWVPRDIKGNAAAEKLYRDTAGLIADLYNRLEEARRRVVNAEATVGETRDLLATWRRNRASPSYGLGAPGPLYVAGMAAEADSLIAALDAVLDPKEKP